ncbi:MAG: hypothetical protein V1775_11445 [Bacteroidota bacterium]
MRRGVRQRINHERPTSNAGPPALNAWKPTFFNQHNTFGNPGVYAKGN